MRRSIFSLIQTFTFFVVFLLANGLVAQDHHRDIFTYISPLPGARYILPEQKISFRIRPEIKITPSSFQVFLTGTRSGQVDGQLNQSKDGNTWFFTPVNGFSLDEKVNVRIVFHNGIDNKEFSYEFFTTALSKQSRDSITTARLFEELNFDPTKNSLSEVEMDNIPSINDSLPEGFPEITITHWNNPSPGYIFVSPLTYANGHYYMIILDNYATPVFYQELEATGGTDFKLQPKGYLSLFQYNINKFVVYDSAYLPIDTIATGNGYTTDLHELRLYENGHSFLMAYDPQLVDMSEIVPGGHENAIVTGLIVQELNADKEVIFQWRSWDHYQITDATWWIDLTEESIDYVHGNSIEICSDTTMMISARNMNEITKINRNSGEIIWRLNGENNMFVFDPPEEIFCVQHSIRLMPDSSNISIFDNGGCHSPQYSSAIEYILDEENFTCTMVERLQSDPDIFGAFMGHTQRLFNGHTINGWGNGIPSVTEFGPEGDILLQFSFPYTNYRAFKFDWEHSLFTTNVEALDFGSIQLQDSVVADVQVINTGNEDLIINRVLNHLPGFSVVSTLPLEVAAGESAPVFIKFKPDSAGTFNDVLTLCWEIHSDTLTRRVSRQVVLTGIATGDDAIYDLNTGGFSVYPNPFENNIRVQSLEKRIREVSIVTMDGKEVFQLNQLDDKELVIKPSLEAGFYILQLLADDGRVYSGKIVRE